MKRSKIILVLLAWMLVWPCTASAVEVAPRISDREIVESLVELKQQQKALNQRMDDMNKRMDEMNASLNQRMDEMNANLNQRMDEMNANLNQRMDDMNVNFNQRFDSLSNLMLTMFGSVMALIIALVGYMVWDRRTAQKPLREKMTNLEEETRQLNKQLEMNNPSGSLLERLVAAFRELSKTDEKVADVLRSFSLL